MKRDIDLTRQLLLDIEARGADCSVSVLRADADHDAQERVRYHLRLLVDAGCLKEIDRTSSGVPCLRLTDAGHELIELARSESRWREAKWACHERTGGLSLTVVRGILLDWALSTWRGRRRWRRSQAERFYAERPEFDRPYLVRPANDIEPTADDWLESADPWSVDDEQVRYVRVRPQIRNGWRAPPLEPNGSRRSPYGYEVSLPDYLI